MQYWWVNQNQTATAEWSGEYLWSPKRNANGHRNPFYEYMREVIPGDLILSFVKTQIPRIGIAKSYAYSCPKPAEFGNAGPNWDRVGWKVDVHWIELGNKIRPAEHLPTLRPLFPTRYGPLQNNGRGKQAIYLTRLPEPLMSAIVSLIGHQARTLMTMNRMFEDAQPDPIGVGQYEWEEHLRQQVENDGRLILSPAAHTLSLRRMGIPQNGQLNVGAFHEGQREYLDYHRDSILLQAGVRDG